MIPSEPGEGWRQVKHHLGDEDFVQITEQQDGQRSTRVWVREEPVPPLPTEPYTVIRVTYKDGKGQGVYVLNSNGLWYTLHTLLNDGGYTDSQNDIHQQITGFEVVAEPRSSVAAAVLKRAELWWTSGTTMRHFLDQTAEEFGVER